MGMTIYKLYSSAAGNSVASLDIQLDGIITAIFMTGRVTGVDATDEGFEAEVSFLSTSTLTSNDARGSLMIIQSMLSLVTSGGMNSGINAGLASLEVPVAAGERIHLHISDSGSVTGRTVHAFLYVQDKGIPRVSARRR